MRDVRAAELAGRQFNRVSRQQLVDLGLTQDAIAHRLRIGDLVVVEENVLALPPVLDHDEWGKWMAATLTAPGTVLSHFSAAAALGLWSSRRAVETVTRPGNGGPRRHGGTLVFRSSTLEGECTTLRGIPITSAERTVLDLASRVSERATARVVRDAVRIELTTIERLADARGRHPRQRGSGRIGKVLARYKCLPIERARSGAEVRALEILDAAGLPLPALNVRIAREEADLSWARDRLIIEIDGGPFHLDRGEDARKQECWEAAGWTVRRLSSNEVYEQPDRLIALAPR